MNLTHFGRHVLQAIQVVSLIQFVVILSQRGINVNVSVMEGGGELITYVRLCISEFIVINVERIVKVVYRLLR